MATGFVWHERYMWHNTGRHAGPFGSDANGWLEPDVRHRENADGKRRFYVDRIRGKSAAWGGEGGDGTTFFGRGSYLSAAPLTLELR